MFTLSEDLFNPSYPGHCPKHGDTPFMDIYLNEGTFEVCVKCLNEEQLRIHEEQKEAFRAAGHKVEDVTLVCKEIIDG